MALPPGANGSAVTGKQSITVYDVCKAVSASLQKYRQKTANVSIAGTYENPRALAPGIRLVAYPFAIPVLRTWQVSKSP